VLARGLVAGFGALALVVGLLVVFGDDSPDDASRPAAVALGQRETADGSPATGKGASGAKGSTPTSAPGGATIDAATGSSTTTPGCVSTDCGRSLLSHSKPGWIRCNHFGTISSARSKPMPSARKKESVNERQQLCHR